MKKLLWCLGVCFSMLFCLNVAAADVFPTRPITIMVPYPAGGVSDIAVRAIVEPLSKELGQPVLVENLVGGGGIAAAQKVLNAPADGYYLIQGSPSDLILSPLINTASNFKSDDFRMLQRFASAPMVILTRPGLPANTADELIQLARSSSKNQPVSFGSVGVGSLYHLLGEHLARTSGLSMTHLPFSGGASLMTALATGKVDFALLLLSEQVAEMARKGQIKVLGSLTSKRLENAPSIPAVGEGKLMRKFIFATWGGFLVKKGTPESVVVRLNEALTKVMQQPKVRGLIQVNNMIPMRPQTLQESAADYAFEIAMYRAMAKAIVPLTP